LINQEGYGIPFALPSLLICLLVLQIKSSIHLGMMILSGVLSLLFRWALPGNWYIVLTAVAITCAGTVIEMLRRRE
jgi:predicted branched-subunit amino acid permease